MFTNCDPRELVVQLLKRSQCSVQVASVIADDWGIHSWGWNNSGRDGYGQHAEDYAIERANKNRIPDSIIYVAARRLRNQRIVTARPCEDCERLIRSQGLYRVIYRDSNGVWCDGVT